MYIINTLGLVFTVLTQSEPENVYYLKSLFGYIYYFHEGGLKMKVSVDFELSWNKAFEILCETLHMKDLIEKENLCIYKGYVCENKSLSPILRPVMHPTLFITCLIAPLM